MATSRRRKPSSPEEVRALLMARTGDAVEVLLALMRDEGQKPELRMKAAESILDRACGKGAAAGESRGEGVQVLRFEGALEEWSR